MSFAYTAKMEVLNNKIENDCCSIAFLSAIIKTAGEISLDSQHNLKVEILTELESLFERIDSVIFQYYGKNCTLSKIEDVDIVKVPRYKITLPGEIVDKLLVDLGIMSVLNGGLNDINETIANFIIADDCCKRAYVMGAFVGCATSNIRIKSYSNAVANSSGYHLEFVFSKEKRFLLNPISHQYKLNSEGNAIFIIGNYLLKIYLTIHNFPIFYCHLRYYHQLSIQLIFSFRII